MKDSHTSLSITRDYGSFDGSCGTTFCPCAQALLPRGLSHSVPHNCLLSGFETLKSTINLCSESCYILTCRLFVDGCLSSAVSL